MRSYLHVLPNNRVLRSEDLHHSRGVAPSGFRPCGRFPTAASLGVSVPVWPITLSRSAMHRCLGKPLPYQLANAADPSIVTARPSFTFEPCGSKYYPVLAPVSKLSQSYGRLSTCYSPVRR